GIVTAGFDGACPRMRCMCCPRTVCEPAWAPLVDTSVFETFRNRATTLLSLQCGSCHRRGSAMVVPPPDHSYSSALDALMTDIATNLEKSRRHHHDDDDDDNTAATEDNKGTDPNAPKDQNGIESNAKDKKGDDYKDPTTEAFRLALGRYMSGEDVDVVRFYDEVEAVISLNLEA
ncbi:unnamed protein product, partial [Laminaria digitata]